jgi:hypothetical protein
MMDKVIAAISRLLEGRVGLSIAAAIVLVLLGVGRGVQYKGLFPIDDPQLQIACFVAALVFLLLAVYLSYESSKPTVNPDKYGIKISQLPPGGSMDAKSFVSGTIAKKLPENYTLRLFHKYTHGIYPLGDAHFEGKNWTAFAALRNVQSGSIQTIEAYIVGPCGERLANYIITGGSDAYKRNVSWERQQGGEPKKMVPYSFPAITSSSLPDDTRLAAEINVRIR